MLKRIISFLSAVVISLSLYLVPAAAAWQNEVGHWYVNSSFAQWAVGGVLSASCAVAGSALGSVTIPVIGTVEGSVWGSVAGAGLARGLYDIASYYAAGYTDEDFLSEEQNFVSDLDYTTVSDVGLFSVYPDGWTMAANDYLNPSNVKSYKGGYDWNGYALQAISSGTGFKVDSEYLQLPKGVYSCKFETAYGSMENGYGTRYGDYYYIFVYGIKDGVSTQLAEVKEGYGFPASANFAVTTDYDGIYIRTFPETNSAESAGSTLSFGFTIHIECLELADPFETDISSRPSSLMSAINQYNIDNSYTDNSTNVNYYIVPTGVDPSADTAVSPAIYDEETLVYTDPVTGTEYLTNGWTYDYLTRCYTLDMADDSYLIGDTVIDTIKLTYGDELLTVDHYSSGSLIQSDKYNYVMMSGSECALNGHTYNITDTQDPTCTGSGYRTYTCSVCGDQYVEDIPQIDHAYGDFTVEQEATCTAPGIHSFTCTTCGGQYTDTIAALGHDWQPTASTEESYVMPDGVKCPDCHGTDFTWERQDLELKTGKNLFDISVLEVQKPAIKSPWISELGADYIVVSMPTGYTSNGLLETGITLAELSPGLRAGETYFLTMDTDSYLDRIHLSGSDRFLLSRTSFVLDEADLSSFVYLYGMNVSGGQTAGDCRISNIQIELGTVGTAYEPYDPEYVEIIPPIYTFTCSDAECGAVWTKEAEYQGATVTYTCTRCDATRMEAAGEEAGLFHSIGNLIADGITWVTTKMKELVQNLSGINDIFDDYTETVKESTGQFPAFIGAIIALMPEDYMTVIWFGLIALVVLAVWKKWFS